MRERVLLGRLLFHSQAGMILPSPFLPVFSLFPKMHHLQRQPLSKECIKRTEKKQREGGPSSFFVHHHTDDSNNELAKNFLAKETFPKYSNNTYTTVIDAKLLMVPAHAIDLRHIHGV